MASPLQRDAQASESFGRVQKEHRCSHCQRQFRRSEHLQRHVRTHTREKPYVCYCGAAFTRPDLLKRHKGITHANEPPTHSAANFMLTGKSPNTRNLNVTNFDLSSDPVLWDGRDTTAPAIESRDLLTSDPCQDFAGLIDTLGLPLDWDGLFNQSSTRLDQDGVVQEMASVSDAEGDVARYSHSIRHASIPSEALSDTILPIPKETIDASQSETRVPSAPSVTEEQMEILRLSLAQYQHAVVGFRLPTRQALTRYITAYFDAFDPHLPFIHAPTFNATTCNLELLLAIASAGAQYRFEHNQGVSLFFAAKSILNERIKERERLDGALYSSPSALNSGTPRQHAVPFSSYRNMDTEMPTNTQQAAPTNFLMDDARCLLCLIVFSAWKSNPSVFRASLSLQSTLAQSVRGAGLRTDGFHNNDWRSWAMLESDRRTKFLAFCFMNLLSHAYNQPPVLLSSEINLSLPSSSEEWTATHGDDWLACRQRASASPMMFEDGLHQLLSTTNSPILLKPAPSVLGNYVLLHGLLQQVLVMRQACLPSKNMSHFLRTTDLEALEAALRSWTLGWQQAPESSLDPLNRNGPIPFTSTALLGLAYCRICLDVGPFRALESRDPKQIAQALLRTPELGGGIKLIHALLHAAHSLSIPVKLGIEYVARSQGFFWSIQHALCCFEFAILLHKWLLQLSQAPKDHALNNQEEGVLEWVSQIVEDGMASLDDTEVRAWNCLDYRGLALSVVNLWSFIMKGNVQWEIVTLMGHALEEYVKVAQ